MLHHSKTHHIYNTGDGAYGVTCCSNIPCLSKCLSFFCIPEYSIKISMDRSNGWCFFGGKVLHGMSQNRNSDKFFKKHDIFYFKLF